VILLVNPCENDVPQRCSAVEVFDFFYRTTLAV
jgi:hypothetical protein